MTRVIDVIQYKINDRELVGKFKSGNIRLGSQLVAYPSQTAYIVKGGNLAGLSQRRNCLS